MYKKREFSKLKGLIFLKCYTIGHSKHKIETFLDLLTKFSINCVVDVRSTPYSRFAEHFNQENLKNYLKRKKITYVYLGNELGARHTNKTLLDNNGNVLFELVRNTEEFKKGLLRIIKGINKGYVIAIMCSEKNPEDCHRTILVSYSLAKKGVEISHVLASGDLKKHSEIENELLDKYFLNRNQLTLFNNDNDINYLDEAFKLKGQEISYNALEVEE